MIVKGGKQVVLVTGAAHRIGREISLALAELGNYHIAVHYHRSQSAAAKVVEEINNKRMNSASLFHADLSDIDCLPQLMRSITLTLGSIDHVVNNASAYERDNLTTVTSKSFDRMIGINLKAPLFISKEFINYRQSLSSEPPFIPSSSSSSSLPSIINILDQKVVQTNGDFLSYTIAKHGLHSLTEMLAKEAAPFVRVNAVAPGPVLPHATQTPLSFQESKKTCLLNHGPSARDIADAVSYLISAKSVTGQTLFVDSGFRFSSRLVDPVE